MAVGGDLRIRVWARVSFLMEFKSRKRHHCDFTQIYFDKLPFSVGSSDNGRLSLWPMTPVNNAIKPTDICASDAGSGTFTVEANPSIPFDEKAVPELSYAKAKYCGSNPSNVVLNAKLF